MATPRFNLRNASLYLTKLKNKYQKQPPEDQNIYDNTFIDEEDELTSNPSIQKLSQKKIDSSHTHRYEPDPIPENSQPSPQATQAIHYEQKQTQQTQFCDLIIIKYLEETLAIYKGDLEVLEHNRENLEQQIYFIGKKIGKLHQLAAENTTMKLQIDQLNSTLEQTIAHYHQSNQRLFMQKIASNKIFHKYQQKLKQFLLFNKQNHFDSDPYLKPDCQTASQNEQYTAFLNYKQEQSRQISNCLKNSPINEQEKIKFSNKLFEGKEQIYLTECQKSRQRANPKPSQKPQEPKKKQKKVILYDEFADEDDDFGKKGKDGKGKKMTEAEKSLLLGDLKNFSKSFKIPK